MCGGVWVGSSVGKLPKGSRAGYSEEGKTGVSKVFESSSETLS